MSLSCSHDGDASGFLRRVSHSHILATAISHCHRLKAPGKEQEGGGKVDSKALAYPVEDSRSKSGCLALQQTHFAVGENNLAETQSPKSRSGYSLKCRLTGHN